MSRTENLIIFIALVVSIGVFATVVNAGDYETMPILTEIECGVR